MRTDKLRGPGLPMLRAAQRAKARCRAMGANKPGPQGDREAAVKTIARGRPGRPAEPWYLPPAFLSAGGPRTSVEVRSSPRPLIVEGDVGSMARARFALRECIAARAKLKPRAGTAF